MTSAECGRRDGRALSHRPGPHTYQRLLEKHFRTSPDSGMGGLNAIREGLGGAECHRWEGLGEHVETRTRGGLLPQPANDMCQAQGLQKPHGKGG